MMWNAAWSSARAREHWRNVKAPTRSTHGSTPLRQYPCILLAKAGRLNEATAVVQSMLTAAKNSANVRWEYLALQAAGTVEVRRGKIDEGLELLKKSHRRAASISTAMEVPVI